VGGKVEGLEGGKVLGSSGRTGEWKVDVECLVRWRYRVGRWQKTLSASSAPWKMIISEVQRKELP
jgi:hypothetical protein